LAQIRGVRWISLQKGVGSQQLAEVRERFPVVDLGSRLQDFTDTAAVMKNLDLVITSDTAAAHLAGALGVPVWVALSFAADWRWLLDRSDSPWYPTMRLFRQRERGNWQAVFEAIEKALSERLVANPATHNQRRRSTH
jgi:ADP-heptose:LPS heptosyltransferase